MEKLNYYVLKNFRTIPFSKRSYNEQHEYFVKADVYHVGKPHTLLDIVPIWQNNRYGNIIDIIHNHEVNGDTIPNELFQPVPGEFVNFEWPQPLYRIYTDDDVRLGRCSSNMVGKYVRNLNGTIKVFNRVKVFCLIHPSFIEVLNHNINIRGEINLIQNVPRYLPNWQPEYRAQKSIEYCYEEVNH